MFKSKKIKKDVTIILFTGHLTNLISNSMEVEKYVDPRIPMVIITIGNFLILNTLIDLGATINVMIMDIIQSLNLHNLRPTPTIIEIVDDQGLRRNV